MDGLEDTLEKAYFGHNKLGDQLNPMFTTNEFKRMKKLQILDLQHNEISDIESGIVSGCTGLQVNTQNIVLSNH